MPGSRPSDLKLAAALEAAGLDDLAAAARDGDFNDYFSSHATPKTLLATLLRDRPGAEDLIARMAQGEFDSGIEEGLEWRRTPEGERVFAELVAEEPLSDPRELGGEMAGPGGPFDHGQTVLDASKALIVDYQDICKVDRKDASGPAAFALLFSGQINQSSDRAKVMLLGDLDLLAAIITQCHGVALRAGEHVHDELNRLCAQRWKEMPH